MRFFVALVLIGSLGLTGTARADAPAAAADPHKPKLPRVMVVDFPPDPAFTPQTIAALNDFLAGALLDQGLKVVTAADIGAVLGLERQKTLLGCAENSCLAELGGALGVEFIVRGAVASLDKDTALNLSLVDSHGTAINAVRTLVHGRSSSNLVQALEPLVPKLVAPIKAKAAPAVAPAGGLASSNGAQTSPPSGASSNGLPLGLTIGGGAVLAAGAVLGALSIVSAGDATTLAATGAANTSSTASQAALEGRIGVGAMVVGAAVAAVGIVMLLQTSPGSGGAP